MPHLGPGEFVSKDGVWKPAMRPEHVPAYNDRGKIVDSIKKDDEGNPVMVLDPAAQKAIVKQYGEGAMEAPVVSYPEDVERKKDRERMDRLEVLISKQAESIATMSQLLTAVVASSMGDKLVVKPKAEALPPLEKDNGDKVLKRRGRPPRVKVE